MRKLLSEKLKWILISIYLIFLICFGEESINTHSFKIRGVNLVPIVKKLNLPPIRNIVEIKVG